jgi:hypothetical protein
MALEIFIVFIQYRFIFFLLRYYLFYTTKPTPPPSTHLITYILLSKGVYKGISCSETKVLPHCNNRVLFYLVGIF